MPDNMPHPRYTIGVDLGQANDYTAICVIQHFTASDAASGGNDPELARGIPAHGVRAAQSYGSILVVRYLERIRDKPYTQIAHRIKELGRNPQLQTFVGRKALIDRVEVDQSYTLPPLLAIDGTGVGRAVVDVLRASGVENFTPITITGGEKTTKSGGYVRLPKRDLIGALEVGLRENWLLISEGMDLGPVLREELLNYRPKVNVNTGYVGFEPWREGQHDDLLLATAIAAWRAVPQRSGGMLRGAYTIGSDGTIRADNHLTRQNFG